MRQRNLVPALTGVVLSAALAACSGGTAPTPAQGGYGGGWPQGPVGQGDQDGPAVPLPPEMQQAEGPSGNAAAAPAGAQGAAAGGLPALRTDQLQQVRIMDSAGFGQPMVAATVEIPAGWQTVGGVGWNDSSSCVANQLQITWSAIAPDSLTALEIMPGFNWQVAGTEVQFNPCPSAPYRSTRELLEATVQRARPGARVLDYQRMPEVEQKMAQMAQGQGGAQAQVRPDAGRLLVAYEKDGVDMREMFTAAVTFSQAQGNLVGGTGLIHAARAPNGRLDFSLTERIANSMQPDPRWMEAMKQRSMANIQRIGSAQSAAINDWHNRQMAIINAKGAADRHAERMRGNQQVADIYSGIARNTSDTSDRMQQRAVAAINEVNNYTGVDGGRVSSSIHGGNQVFQDTSNPNNAYSTSAPYPNPPSGYVELQREP
ncbi:hypothetical protein [Luteimonas sp. J29]|uniref:hypothetical protein n=1 Tax=Luteimonas sp. J29 TaxID=935863 RepID=UPI00047DD641|nr:hypothetical protein [Luteimonas sp. J29]